MTENAPSAVDEKSVRMTRKAKLGIMSVIFGIVGWFASFELLTEYVKTLQNDDYIPGCSLSVLVSCAPNMSSWQGSIFGFSNPIIGVTAFIIPVIIGVLLLSAVDLPVWFMKVYSAGLLAGFAFILWLSYQSIFDLYTLCPWCMVVWVAMIPLFWTTLTHTFSDGGSKTEGAWSAIYSYRWVIIAFFYILIATVAQLKLDWLGEF